MPPFVPLSLTPSPSVSGPPPTPADIRIELRRGATGMKITWPIAAAAGCAAWMRATTERVGVIECEWPRRLC